mgnify:CR=1 FL=1
MLGKSLQTTLQAQEITADIATAILTKNMSDKEFLAAMESLELPLQEEVKRLFDKLIRESSPSVNNKNPFAGR